MIDIPSPLTSAPLFKHPQKLSSSIFPLVRESLAQCKKSGMHNPFKRPERYRKWGDVLTRLVEQLHRPAVHEHFVSLINSALPKSRKQIEGEVIITRNFLENFTGDNPRLGTRGFTVAGDHEGQMSNGFRFPYGPVVIITPFNFPYEIPVLQFIAGVFTGNKVLLKADNRTSIIMEHFLKLLEHCGGFTDSFDLVHCKGNDMEKLLVQNKDLIRQIHFTGSSKIANHICHLMDGKIRFEDSGFNWKIIGPDFQPSELDYVASQCDQDSYSASGQKCSKESVLLIHKNW